MNSDFSNHIYYLRRFQCQHFVNISSSKFFELGFAKVSSFTVWILFNWRVLVSNYLITLPDFSDFGATSKDC